jgi:integrase
MVDTRRGEPLYALRFRANGRRQYVRLGTAADGWTRERAERELADTMALVRKGLWRPPDKGPDPAKVDPGFHQFASHWIKANEAGWRPNTRLDYRWQVEMHLLPFFKAHRLSQITIAEVDRYRAAKLAEERPLSATSINKTITRLGQILETAVEYGYIERNPARGKRRRVKATKPAPVWLDRAEQITALLDAATELDREASSNRDHVARRATLATFVFAGLRIGELTALRWRDVDLAANRITVRDGGGDSTSERAKTDAGYRVVDLLPVLRDTLTEYKAAQDPDSDALVFPSSTGRRLNPSNIRRRVLSRSVERANERLATRGDVPLPDGLTPHKLRHSFASLLVALGVDPGAVMDQLGHTDPGFTLRVYRHGMRRDPASRAALEELVGAGVWAANGQRGLETTDEPVHGIAAYRPETP